MYLSELKKSYTSRAGSDGPGTAIHVITSPSNLGGAGGFELGVREALARDDYDSLLFIDDDAVLSSDFLEKLSREAESHSDVGLFAGAVICAGEIDTNHRRDIKSRLIFSERWIPREAYQASFFCELATFCGLLISRDIIEAAGAPRGDYFIWYDDTEYCLRCERQARRLGYKDRILVVSDAKIDHRTRPVQSGGDILMRTDWRSYYGWRNRYDVAKNYLCTLCAITVKIEYHLLRLKSRMMSHSNDEATRMQGSFNVTMITEVLRDIRARRFGKRDGY